MGFTYTLDQQKVIEASGGNILVSAAAGSGKTAVLVQRIIRKITNPEKLLSIDELLIVTFTHGAASEMRERIGDKIEEAIENESNENIAVHLMKQLTLLPSARIMTLHSFCLSILKSHYHTIDLDPNFRIGNETELVLMKEEAIDELLEDEYEKGAREFINVIESFAPGKTDEPIKELIFGIYRFAMSNPWPLQWMDTCLEKINITSVEAYEESEYYQIIVASVMEKIGSLDRDFAELFDLMEMDKGPDKYINTVEALFDTIQVIKEALQLKDWQRAVKVYNNREIPSLSTKRKGYDKELAEEAKVLINTIKKELDSVSDLYYNQKSLMDEVASVKENVAELMRLTKLFWESYRIKKEERQIIDFNDIEHMALDILYEDNRFGPVAKGYKEQFEEVLVDEYQDTNEVQEAILLAVSKDKEKGNLFMVGDLKQSIYKFRLAKPEIFKKKYNGFSYKDNSEEFGDQKIDLAKNFRSRIEIVDFINAIFSKTMSSEIGDVDYNDRVKLYPGRSQEEETNYKPELMFVERSGNNGSKVELEGQAVAKRIRELIVDEELEILDKESGTMRKVEYKDICILMRSPTSTIEDMKAALDKEGIPYVTESSSGYFDAIEVQTIINVLKIIDNPYQDIPLIAVLRSELFGLDEQELFEIRKYKDKGCFYETLLDYCEGNSTNDLEEKDSLLVGKLKEFLGKRDWFKEQSMLIGLYELIHLIYKETDFIHQVRFMENGEQRMTNLLYLEEQAKIFEKSSYKGLFNFIRYVEHIKKYDIEIPVPITAGLENGVTLMSIHKSKGLEFPVVFVIDLHKKFNMTDLNKSYIFHQDLGIGTDYIDIEKRQKKESCFGRGIRIKAKGELLSEELRLFYVALTRAREKLILVSVVEEYETKVLDKLKKVSHSQIKLKPATVMGMSSYLDLLLMSCSVESDLFIQSVQQGEESPDNEIEDILDQQRLKKLEFLQYLSENKGRFHSEEAMEKLLKAYEYEDQSGKYMTLSVTDLKQTEEQKKISDQLYDEHKLLPETVYKEKKIPAFIEKQEDTLKGAEYGTMIHKVLSLLPIKEGYDYIRIKEFVDALFEKEILDSRYNGKIYLKSILEFTKTSLYTRMVRAAKQKQLYKEQSFVLGINDGEDIRMIQGIMDVFFVEDNRIVLLDYKTDFVMENGEKDLVKKYKTQMDYYRKAIEDSLSIPVKETYIYSLSIGKLLDIDKVVVEDE